MEIGGISIVWYVIVIGLSVAVLIWHVIYNRSKK